MVHPIQCRCGALKGQLTRTGRETRLMCYCKDCQAFARFLQPIGDILDAAGGTDIVQTAPAFVRFTAGQHHLACMRLSEKGMLRWYASCCNTPIGNTAATGKLAFVGLIHNCLTARNASSMAAFGPVLARINTQSAIGTPQPKESGLFTVIRRAIVQLVKARLNGSYKQTPFFDLKTNQPVVPPKILRAEERQALAATE